MVRERGGNAQARSEKKLKSFRLSLFQKAHEVEGEEPSSQPAGCEIPRENAGRRSRGISDSEAQEREQKQSGGLFLPGKPSPGVSPKANCPLKSRRERIRQESRAPVEAHLSFRERGGEALP